MKPPEQQAQEYYSKIDVLLASRETPKSLITTIFLAGHAAGKQDRQKEIDDLRLWFANRLWAVGNSAKNDEISYLVSGRQGGHRAWRELQEEAAKILETNAAATRVMEVKG